MNKKIGRRADNEKKENKDRNAKARECVVRINGEEIKTKGY